MYNISGMTDKNKDALLKDILDLVDSSSNDFLHSLFPDRPDPDSKKRPPTAGDRIKSSANALVVNLMKSQPSYIRTIKPNQNKSPTEYDTSAILHQIKYLGLQENIRVRRAGFAYRNTFEKMVERFYLLSPNTSYAGEYTWTGDSKSGCEKILNDVGISKDEWQMGVSKAFIKNPETLFALETMRDKYWHNMAMRIQRAFRNYLRYKNECAIRIQRMWKNNKEKLVYAQMRDYSHQVLAERKERRRFSLISMRKFLGDYLDVGSGNSAEGELLRNASGMSSNETVAFSSRIQLLISKLGRSSKPSPRFLVLTDKTLYIIVTQMVNKQIQTICERKIALNQISNVGTSELRDDWLVLNVRNSEEPDPVLHCYFKTELITTLLQRTSGSVNVTISNSLEFSKKKDKKSNITFKKDETVQKDDVYKSSTVSVCTGEPASSQSRPPAKKKPGIVRPITGGKLLRPGGPSNANNKPKPRAVPRTTKAVALPSGNSSSAGTPSIPAASTSTPTSSRAAPPQPKRASVAPPPRPPPQVSATPKYKALFAFETDENGEMALVKDELVEVSQKDDNGWWLVKKNGSEGWAPSNYLELVPQAPPPKPKPAPPPPAATKRAPPAAPAASSQFNPASKSTSSFGAPAPVINKHKPVNTVTKPSERPTAETADPSAQPRMVMPGMDPGGFAAVLAKKKAQAAAERGEAPTSSNGASSTPPQLKPKPPAAPPKPSSNGNGTTGRAMPPPPPRR